ncbi:hypothetical protein, partial [Belliella pelovolcani]|uniref:hypothetical protein n=1 Tax=Belliella pelovolcani TaxID=529505 RepID=UPI00391A1CEA
MPTLNKQYQLTITVEQFLNACSNTELHELDLLLSSGRYQNRMQEHPEEEDEEDAKHYDTLIESRKALTVVSKEIEEERMENLPFGIFGKPPFDFKNHPTTYPKSKWEVILEQERVL